MSKNKYKWVELNNFKLNKKMLKYKTEEEKKKAIVAQEKVVASAVGQSAINAAKAKLVEITDAEVE